MTYKFCPKCGNKLINIKENNRVRLQCSNCKFVFYQNSKPTASALILDGDQVLLGKRNINPSKGMWDVPGGFLESREHPEDGMKREVLEETGLKVEIIAMTGIFMDKYGIDGDATLNICYTVKITGGKEKTGDDLEELRWFKIFKLPKKIAFKNGREMLNKLKEWQRKKNGQTK